MQQMNMAELLNVWKSKPVGSLILDVRTPEEFSEGRVPGCCHIPLDQLSSRAAELDLTKQIFVYCRSGGRAGMAAEELRRAGAQNVVVVCQSGLPDWESAGFPVERG